MESKLTYASALAELEQILRTFENGEADIDTLATQVARATELISFCRERLLKVESELQQTKAE